MQREENITIVYFKKWDERENLTFEIFVSLVFFENLQWLKGAPI